jgi:hypothetical protein
MSRLQSTVLRVNAVFELSMGIAFSTIPNAMIPDLGANGVTTTRVFGTSLMGLAYMSWTLASIDATARRNLVFGNLIFHAFGFFALGLDVLTRGVDESPFILPIILHWGLTWCLIWALVFD